MSDTVAGIIWLALGTALLAFAALFVTEGVLYLTGRALITSYIRDWSLGHWYVAIAVGVALVAGASMALTHFVLDA